MRSFIFLGMALAFFIAILVAHQLITNSPLRPPGGGAGEGQGLDPEQLALCLASQGDLLFGAPWCPACRHQEELFGPAVASLGYVDCDNQPAVCADAGVRAIPAWQIGGQLHTGVKTLDQLADLSGCRDQATLQGAPGVIPEPEAMEAWEVSEISYSWRDEKGGFHVTTEAPPPGARDVEIFR